MGKIKLLDCTLRDGGYINNWNFGSDAIIDIEKKIEKTGVDILEVGFLKDEDYNKDRTIFNDERQIEKIIHPKQENIDYAAMVEVLNPLPIEKLVPKSDTSVDIIRVIVWKRLLKEGFEYCKAIVEKGYKVCIQPARTSQYSESEFVEMIELFNQINPMAVYVVDSWGTQQKEDVLDYAYLADRHLNKGIAIGFHGHNNLQQVFSCSQAFVEINTDRDIIIDGSIHGIGRGAGNLNIELFAQYLNRTYENKYNLLPMFDVYSEYISKIELEYNWGYSLPYNLTATYDCNPQFAEYYGKKKDLPVNIINKVLSSIKNEDKIIFTEEVAEYYLSQLYKK